MTPTATPTPMTTSAHFRFYQLQCQPLSIFDIICFRTMVESNIRTLLRHQQPHQPQCQPLLLHACEARLQIHPDMFLPTICNWMHICNILDDMNLTCFDLAKCWFSSQAFFICNNEVNTQMTKFRLWHLDHHQWERQQKMSLREWMKKLYREEASRSHSRGKISHSKLVRNQGQGLCIICWFNNVQQIIPCSELTSY